jgi:hypothetical protein
MNEKCQMLSIMPKLQEQREFAAWVDMKSEMRRILLPTLAEMRKVKGATWEEVSATLLCFSEMIIEDVVLGFGMAKKRTGRPSSFTQEIAETICAGLAEGRSLRSICSDEGMPTRPTVTNWLVADPVFFAQYARARDVGIDTIAEHAIDEATSADLTYEDIARARLAFDARRWYVGKLAPKKYGDKVQAEISGPDGQAVGLQAVRPLTPPEVIDYVGGLLADSERVMGLPPGNGDDKERIQAIVQSGKPLPPALYRIIHADVKDD